MKKEQIDNKDVIESKSLGGGFTIFYNMQGYFIGFVDDGLEAAQQIDKSAYNTIMRSNGGRKQS